MAEHEVVSREEWTKARMVLLAREKEASRLRDAVNAERLALPWVRVEEDYRFDSPAGPQALADLFAGRSQLMVYHFMLAPGWEAGCVGCSFVADHMDGAAPHLNAHDVTLVAVSRAPLAQIEAYKRRMGWSFPWVSSNGSSFNYDYGVSFTDEEIGTGTVAYNYGREPAGSKGTEGHGLSAFIKNSQGRVFHTYSSYARGVEEMIGALMILDRAPHGRNEGSTMDWVRRHDEYDAAPKPSSCCHS
jgi:predicted dithiol-disulfide oxidoreductase (DUF899 family)